MEAVAMIRQGHMAGSDTDPEDAAWTIRQQVIDCGMHQGLEVDYDEDSPPTAERLESLGEQVERFEIREREELLSMLFQTMTNMAEGTVERNMVQLCSISIVLTAEERLLLQLCYRDNMLVRRVGEMLGLNRHQVHGRLRRLLQRLRDDFTCSGLAGEIVEMLR